MPELDVTCEPDKAWVLLESVVEATTPALLATEAPDNGMRTMEDVILAEVITSTPPTETDISIEFLEFWAISPIPETFSEDIIAVIEACVCTPTPRTP